MQRQRAEVGSHGAEGRCGPGGWESQFEKVTRITQARSERGPASQGSSLADGTDTWTLSTAQRDRLRSRPPLQTPTGGSADTAFASPPRSQRLRMSLLFQMCGSRSVERSGDLPRGTKTGFELRAVVPPDPPSAPTLSGTAPGVRAGCLSPGELRTSPGLALPKRLAWPRGVRRGHLEWVKEGGAWHAGWREQPVWRVLSLAGPHLQREGRDHPDAPPSCGHPDCV